jgi:putative ABC transport system substrate-binding protein
MRLLRDHRGSIISSTSLSTDRVGRREFITLIGGAAGLPFAARAQRPDRMHRVGVLGNTPESAEDLRQALHELGWIEGQNITIEWRWAAGRLDHLPELAAELVRLPVDLIITITHRVALVAKETTTTIPIVFARVNDPVGVGLVPSLARPGSNLTGISTQGLDLIGIRLQLLKEATTQFARVNERPRETLQFETPAERFNACVASTG